MLLRVSISLSKTLSFLSYIIQPTQSMILLNNLNILSVRPTDSTFLNKHPNADRTVMGYPTRLIFHSRVPFISTRQNLFPKPFYDKFLLVLLTMPNGFINPIYFPAPFARIVTLLLKPLSTFFGTVHVGSIYDNNTPNYYVFIVYSVHNGPIVSSIVVGLK